MGLKCGLAAIVRNTHAVAIPEHSHLSLLTPGVAAENAPRCEYSPLPPSCTFQDEAVQVHSGSFTQTREGGLCDV